MPCRRPGGFGAVNGCGSPYAAVWDVPRAPTAASSANGSTRPFADLHGHAGGWSTEREWTERAINVARLESLLCLGPSGMGSARANVEKHRDYHLVIILCAVYAGISLVQGGTKLALNVYRGWVGERAKRDLRRRIRSVIEAPPESKMR
jgi:hypothetical protein